MRRTALFAGVLGAVVCGRALAQELPLENADFERGLEGWTMVRGAAMVAVTPQAAAMGKMGLRLTDESNQEAALLTGSPLPAKPGATYLLRFWGRMEGASAGTNVKIDFLDADGQSLKGVQVPRGWPAVSVKYPFGFSAYEARAAAPADAVKMRVAIETWGGGISTTSMDDFALYDISDGKMPATNLEPALAKAAAAKASGAKVPKVVLKVDDLGQHRDSVHPYWQRFADEIQRRKIKACIGIVFETMDTDCPKYVQWIQNLNATGLFEFWNHGYDHKMWEENGQSFMEYKGTSFEHQKEHMSRSNRLAREKLGIPMRTFGPPGGGMDASTFKILEEDPDIKVILFPGPPREIPGKVGLPRNFAVGIEYTTFLPDYGKLVEGYVRNLDSPYFVLQGHPKAWDATRWATFVKQLDFLQDMGAEFVFAADFAKETK